MKKKVEGSRKVAVLLQENVNHLGRIGELVRVRPGFARNFLLPQRLAVVADVANKRAFEQQMVALELKKAKVLKNAQETAARVSSVSLTVRKPVGEDERIFGTVTTHELSELFTAQGYEFDRKDITILDEIKKVGVYRASVKLHPEVSQEFKVWVVAQES